MTAAAVASEGRHVSAVVAEAIEARRDRLNVKYAAARKGGSGIDGEAFLGHLAGAIGPTVDAVAAVIPERAGATLEELYDVSLELFSAGVLGASAKYPVVADVWARLLPAVPGLVMRDPRRVSASLSNAAFNLARTAGARPEQWLGQMIAIAPSCQGVGQLLECGKIAAWRAGMAHYRQGALTAAKVLPAALAAAALHLPPATSGERLQSLAEAMATDPWFDPTSDGAPAVREVRRVGAFRGFGGEFLRPPSVWASSGQLFVSDGEGNWQLVADLHGQVLVRNEAAPPAGPMPAGVGVTRDGLVRWLDQQAVIRTLANPSAVAFDGRTLAVTLPTSHHVFLVARAAPVGGNGHG